VTSIVKFGRKLFLGVGGELGSSELFGSGEVGVVSAQGFAELRVGVAAL
jgi:hypothetical protein